MPSTTSTTNDKEFKHLDASSYDAVTSSYDHFTERFTTPIARRLVSLANLTSKDRVLDVATGTGVVARLARRSSVVVGADLSTGMLAKARANATAENLDIEFVQTDAEAMQFPEKSFDVVLSLFGLMHFPHPETALAEMLRVLKPGGRLVIGVGSSPAFGTLQQAAYAWDRGLEMLQRARSRWIGAPEFLDALVRKHIPTHAGPETAPITRTYGHPGAFLPRLVQEAGFVKLQRTWDGYSPRFSDVEEYWELQATYSTFARKRLSAAQPEQVAAVKKEFSDTCTAVVARGGALSYRYGAMIVAAERPL